MAIYQAAIGARASAEPLFSTFLLGHEVDHVAEIASALDGRVVGRGSPSAMLDALERHVGHVVVAYDLSEDEADIDLLAQLDVLAAERFWPLIVSTGVSNIDAAAASCTRADLTQLCDPAPEDWVAAFLQADVRLQQLHDRSVRENEAARLARLNAEVARIAEVVARLSDRSATEARRAREAPLRYAPPAVDFQVTAAQVREVIRARRLRDRFFEGGLFEDPAWDMLLDLLAAQLERAQVSVSSLCIAAAVPPTTALRWITKLTDAGLIEREADPFDKRRAYLKLSPTAAGAMQRYVAAVREANLPFV